jgi:hypothetical protein
MLRRPVTTATMIHDTAEALLKHCILHLVFENNIFKLGDMFWKQISGTAMGTPLAPPWATAFNALKEMGLLPKLSTYR